MLAYHTASETVTAEQCAAALAQYAHRSGPATPIVRVPRIGGCPSHFAIVSEDSTRFYIRSARFYSYRVKP